MRFVGDFVYLSKEKRESNNKTYYNILLMQGIDTFTCACKLDVFEQFDLIDQFSSIVANISYNTFYKFFCLDDMS